MSKPWRCRVGLHQWYREWDQERHLAIKRCLRCDFRLSAGIPSNPTGFPGG